MMMMYMLLSTPRLTLFFMCFQCAEYCENQAKARDVSPCAAYWTGDGFDEPARYLSEDDERAYRLAFFRPYNAQNMTQQAARPITVEEDENDETSDTE